MTAAPPLPELYSTVEEVEEHLSLSRDRERRGTGPPSTTPAPSLPPPPPPPPPQTPPSERSSRERPSNRHPPSKPVPHLFLHFDVNETILIGDPAGGDSPDECLNKVIAKSALVSTKGAGGDDNGDGNGVGSGCDDGSCRDGAAPKPKVKRSPSSGNVSSSAGGTHLLEPTRWWDGAPLAPAEAEAEAEGAGPPVRPPPPLYTGWTLPPDACSYYRTSHKRFAKGFTTTPHGRIYRPLYEAVRSKLGWDDGDEGGGGGGEFDHFVPAFFHALRHYFPSVSEGTARTGGREREAPEREAPFARALPPPPRVTLVLRTFGTDLPRVARLLSEFARGNHPDHPDYRNPALILDAKDLYRSRWMPRSDGRHVYQLLEGGGEVGKEGAEEDGRVARSGDEGVLELLESKTVAGVRDCYPFWRDRGHAPWAGKPVWARARGVGRGRDHHHVLLDDNIHNDPDDGAGGVRVPIRGGGGDCGMGGDCGGGGGSYAPLLGAEALEAHGKHLIRVPTIRPLLEDDWFVRQIEEARRRVAEEEREGGDEKPAEASGDVLDLSNRNLSDEDSERDDDGGGIPWPLTAQNVNLGRNRLARVPERVFSCAALIVLDVSRNALKGLPSDISRLTNLVELNVLSNRLRLTQLPLDALASLKQLRLLDLRYNRKLRGAALATVRGALLPINPRLEVRCTVPPGAEVGGGGDDPEVEPPKLSACDRDATLLRSQLEPLSTPQLRKRLARSFGVVLDDDDDATHDRETAMRLLSDRYESRGPRAVRRERGTPVPSRRIDALRAALDALPWPRTTRERPKIRAEGYVVLQRPGTGTRGTAKEAREAAKLRRHRDVFDLATKALEEVDPSFARRFTALAVTLNFVGSPHIDTLNVGPFYGLSPGDFSGGGAIAVECSPFLVAEVDTHNRLGKVDGRFPHWVTQYEGTPRYSLIFYVTSGDVETQATAIFPPPGGSCDWVPPPTFVP